MLGRLSAAVARHASPYFEATSREIRSGPRTWRRTPMPIHSSCCRLHFASAPPPQRFATHFFLSTPGAVPPRTADSSRSSQPLLSRCAPSLRGKSCIFRSLRPLKRSCLSFSNSRPLFSIDCSLFSQNAGGGIPLRSQGLLCSQFCWVSPSHHTFA